MDTIISYLNNVFASLPNTPRVKRIKDDLANSMEEKYRELKRSGKSENEAIGIVISEFGNINELIDELGITTDNNKLIVDKDEVQAYQNAKKKSGIFIGIGVFLCILGAASLLSIIQLIQDKILFPSMNEDYSAIVGLIPLFVFVSIAVGLFIFSDVFISKYKKFEKGVSLPYALNEEIKKDFERFNIKYYISIVIGVVICILSAFIMIINITIVGMEALYAVPILLISVAIAAYIFIYFGSIKESFDALGVTPEAKVNKKQNKKAEKLISTIASIVWPLAVVAYLLMGFLGGLWHIGWLIFPVVGIIFGGISGAITNYHND